MPAAGYELRRIAVEGMSRTNPLHAARALWRAARAYVRALSLLRELRPDAVMGGGGYVAGPVGLAAVTLRIPLVLTEADSHLGLTNRVLARGARRVCLAFPLAGREGARYRVTGRPVPPAQDRSRGRAGATRAGRGTGLRARVRGLARRALDQHWPRSRRSRARGPRPSTCCTWPAAATTPSCRAARSPAGGLRPARVPRPGAVRRRARGRRPRGGARRGLGVRDRRERHARDPRALPARLGRSPDRERALDGATRAPRS